MRLVRFLNNKYVLKNAVATPANGGKWDIYAGLCLERRPVIAPQLDPFQKAVAQISEKFEISQALLSNHEVKKLRDK